MNKPISILFCVFILSFTACSPSDLKPSKVTIDGVTYRRDFYDDSLLYPIDITFQEGSYIVDDKEIRRVNFERYDFVNSKGRGDIQGILYCAEEQWEQAKAYYADSDNFVYYCRIGVKNKYRDSAVAAIPDIDPEKFDMLMAFAAKNRYTPFGATNENTRRLPSPGRNEELCFYKESKDGFFTSIDGNSFYVDNDKLVLLYRYDYGYGKYEELLVVDVPDELSQYFVELATQVASGQEESLSLVEEVR